MPTMRILAATEAGENPTKPDPITFVLEGLGAVVIRREREDVKAFDMLIKLPQQLRDEQTRKAA